MQKLNSISLSILFSIITWWIFLVPLNFLSFSFWSWIFISLVYFALTDCILSNSYSKSSLVTSYIAVAVLDALIITGFLNY